jgi:hypothetical protein
VETEQEMRNLIRAVVGEPPGRLTIAGVRRRLIRRRVTQAVSAGLAVVLISGLAAAWSAGAIRISSAPVTSTAHAGPPPYYVSLYAGGSRGRSAGVVATVRATATGRVTGHVRAPRGYVLCDYLTAAAHETFFLVCSPLRGSGREEVVLRFRLDGAGQATRPRPIPGGILKGVLVASAIAASPDGSEVALQVWSTGNGLIYTNTIPLGIEVINTHTGRRALWRAVPELPVTPQFSGATNLSFTEHGSELVALETLCPRHGDRSACSQHEPTQLTAYGPGPRGGSLENGQVLFRQSAFDGASVFDAFIRPGGNQANVLLNRCPRRGTCHQLVAQIPLNGTQGYRVLYRTSGGTAFAGVYESFLSQDPTGRYLILAGQVGQARLNGWIDHGRLRLLTPANAGAVDYEAW